MRRTVGTAVLMVTMVVLASCADSSQSASESGEVDDSSTSGVAGSEPTPATSDVQSRDDLTDLTPVPWTRVVEIDDDRARIFFTAQDPDCYGHAVEVEETSQTITVSLREGVLPDAPDVCAAVAAELSLVVTTTDPIGSRPIVDAAG